MNDFAIIIPIKVTYTNKYILKRLEWLIDFLIPYSIEVVISDATTDSKYKKSILNIIKKNNKATYVHNIIEGIFSASKSRNYGAKYSSSKYLIFFDVDLLINEKIIKQFYIDKEKINKNEMKFSIYPCLYLSEYYTNYLSKKEKITQKDFDLANTTYQKGSNQHVLYNAINTSTILVTKETFFSIGGFNESFIGHGYEDFELIHRLFIFENKQAIGKDYFEDYKTPFIAKYRGFRRYFLVKTLPMYLKGCFTLHMYHPRPLGKPYYKKRTENSEHFISTIRKSVNYSSLALSESLSLNEFSSEFIGFYCLTKDFYKGKNVFLRKLKKLCRNPIQFFKDSVKTKDSATPLNKH